MCCCQVEIELAKHLRLLMTKSLLLAVVSSAAAPYSGRFVQSPQARAPTQPVQEVPCHCARRPAAWGHHQHAQHAIQRAAGQGPTRTLPLQPAQHEIGGTSRNVCQVYTGRRKRDCSSSCRVACRDGLWVCSLFAAFRSPYPRVCLRVADDIVTYQQEQARRRFCMQPGRDRDRLSSTLHWRVLLLPKWVGEAVGFQ